MDDMRGVCDGKDAGKAAGAVDAEVSAYPASCPDDAVEAELYALEIRDMYELLLAGLDVLEQAVEKYRQPARKLQHLELLSHLALPGTKGEK